jgi:hypothetical protein
MSLLGHTSRVALGWLLTFGALAPRAMAQPADASASPSAGAAPQPDARARARELYAGAVAAFEGARYAEAARGFLDADALSPSSDALSSAIAAGRRAGDHLLVARAAERAMGREGSDPQLAGAARVALSEAEPHLSRVELKCSPGPCKLTIDSEEVEPGLVRVLPGIRLVRATFDGGRPPTDKRVSLDAGALYTILLEPTQAGPAIATPPAPRSSSEPAASASPTATDRGHRPLPAWSFFVGVGVTTLLAGATVWSGVDALDSAEHYRSTRTAADRSSALSATRRTDLLLLGTAVVAGATTYAGFVLVDFGKSKRSLRFVPQPAGAQLLLSGQL